MLRSSALLWLVCAAVVCGLPLFATSALADEPVANVDESSPADSIKTSAKDGSQDEAADTAEAAPLDVPSLLDVSYSIDNLLLFLAAVLVIFMQAGFALVESGLNASKNTVNILFKNLMDFCVGVLLFWVIGINLMYPGAEYAGKWFGYSGSIGVADSGKDSSGKDLPAGEGTVSAADIEGGFSTAPGTLRKLHPQADFLFQAAFAATAATIVSGAVAGRLQFSAYLVYSAVITALIYPISGMWKWGGGWLAELGFHDFAGSIVVHAVGGFAGLAGAILLGPRIGRYSPEGKSLPMPGHSMPLAALGVFVLLIGWYGFNPGSQLAFSGTANIDKVMLIAVNTTLAACAGGVGSMLLAWAMFGKPDLTMALNGVLAGLVGITANCDCVTNTEAMLIGGVAGAIVVLAIVTLDKLKIDDPVGAFPVHGACGLWGGIATGIFGADKVLTTQLLGSFAIAAWAFGACLVLFGILKVLGMLRVSPEEESIGLDIGEHGMQAYAI